MFLRRVDDDDDDDAGFSCLTDRKKGKVRPALRLSGAFAVHKERRGHGRRGDRVASSPAPPRPVGSCALCVTPNERDDQPHLTRRPAREKERGRYRSLPARVYREDGV